MLGQTFIVLAFSATAAFAHPQQHKILHRHHHPSGSGSLPQPTGGVYSAGNSTNLISTGSASSFGTSIPVVTVPVVTMTVSPVPSLVASSAVSSQAALAPGTGDGSGDCAAQQTVTSTTIEYFTVTVGGSDQSPVGGASSNTSAAAPSSAFSVVSAASSADSAPTTVGSSPSASSSPEETASSAAQDTIPSSSGAKAVSSPAASATGGGFFEQSGSSSASVLASSTTSSATGSSQTASPPPSSGGSKRGLAYNNAALTDAFNGKGMSWAYNWAGSTSGLPSGLEFVPQLWGQKSFGSWNPPQASALLSLNEPDHPAQANMDPKSAAEAHIKYMNPHGSGSTRIGSPAVTNGNGVDQNGRFWGLDWLAEFFKECNGQCKVDFIAFHWYGSTDQTKYFQSHVQNVTSTASQQWGINSVWLTEFQPSGSPQQQADFLNTNLPFLDQQSAVEKYAYYMVADGNLVSGNAVSSPVGTAYCA